MATAFCPSLCFNGVNFAPKVRDANVAKLGSAIQSKKRWRIAGCKAVRHLRSLRCMIRRLLHRVRVSDTVDHFEARRRIADLRASADKVQREACGGGVLLAGNPAVPQTYLHIRLNLPTLHARGHAGSSDRHVQTGLYGLLEPLWRGFFVKRWHSRLLEQIENMP